MVWIITWFPWMVKSHELLLHVSSDSNYAEFTAATDTHLYLSTCEQLKDDPDSKYYEFVQKIYSCTLDGCEVIKEEHDQIEKGGNWIWGPKFDLETYNGDLYMKYYMGTTLGNTLSKYDEETKEWTTVLEIEDHVFYESLISNEEYLGFTYYKHSDNDDVLYMNLISEEGVSTEVFELPTDEYDVNGSKTPMIYNDHIAVPVKKASSKACNMLVYTDNKYVVQENTVPCVFEPTMISEDMYISIQRNGTSSIPYTSHYINKITDEKVETVLINYGDSVPGIVSKFHIIDEHTIMNIANNDGKWHIIHLSQK